MGCQSQNVKNLTIAFCNLLLTNRRALRMYEHIEILDPIGLEVKIKMVLQEDAKKVVGEIIKTFLELWTEAQIFR